MERRHIKWVPILIAALVIGYQYFGSERFVNPETGRAAHVGMSTQQEAALGFQSYQQVLSESRVINNGPQYEMVRTVASRLARATGKGGEGYQWEVSLVDAKQVKAFCLPG